MITSNLEEIATVLSMSLRDAMMDRDIFRELHDELREKVEELTKEVEELKKENDRLRDLGEDNINIVINK